MEPLELSVKGMTCQKCVQAVTRALMELPSVEKVEVSLENRSAKVWGTAERAALIRVLDHIGFSAA